MNVCTCKVKFLERGKMYYNKEERKKFHEPMASNLDTRPFSLCIFLKRDVCRINPAIEVCVRVCIYIHIYMFGMSI